MIDENYKRCQERNGKLYHSIIHIHSEVRAFAGKKRAKVKWVSNKAPVAQ